MFCKATNGASGGNARPNLLIGHCPLSRPGTNDEYAITGNFVIDIYNSANTNLVTPFSTIGSVDFFPLSGQLIGSAIETSEFSTVQEFDSDFNESKRNHRHRGAYTESSTNKGWLIKLTIKPQSAPRIDRIGIENNLFMVSLRTQVGRTYWLDRANVPEDDVSWSATTNILGTGLSLSVGIPLGSETTEFHRVQAAY